MDKFRTGAAVAVLVTVLTFLGFLVHEHADPTMMAALATIAGATITGVVHYILRNPSHDDAKKDPPSGVLAIALCVGTIVLSSSMVGCSSTQTKRVEADAEYTNEVSQCVTGIKKPGPDASVADKDLAWAMYDGCMGDVHNRWLDAGKDGAQ